MSSTEAWYATRTMQALEILAFEPCSAIQLADGLGVHARTARRLLERLVADGYVNVVEGDRRLYTPTMRLVALAGQVVQRTELAQSAVPYVERLRERSREATHLTMPSYQSVVCVLHRGPATTDAIQPRLRELVPAHATAAGKALLAYRDRWREDILSRPLETFTSHTLATPDAFRPEVTRVRFRGYAIEDGEYQAGVRGVAAPVFDSTGQAIAALGISGSARRLSVERCRACGKLASELASELSEELGASVPDFPTLMAADG